MKVKHERTSSNMDLPYDPTKDMLVRELLPKLFAVKIDHFNIGNSAPVSEVTISDQILHKTNEAPNQPNA